MIYSALAVLLWALLGTLLVVTLVVWVTALWFTYVDARAPKSRSRADASWYR